MRYGVYLRGFEPYRDFELRKSLVRIPEVLIELKKIQQIYDTRQKIIRDVFIDFLSEEGYLHLSVAMQRLLSAGVQKGLVQRIVQRLGPSAFVIGPSDSLSLKKFIFDEIEGEDFLYKQEAQGVREMDHTESGTVSPYGIVRLINSEGKSCFDNVEVHASNIDDLVLDLVDYLSVKRLVTVTVSGDVLKSLYYASASDKLVVQDAIETDPFLGWFDRRAV